MENGRDEEQDRLLIRSAGANWSVTLSMIGVSALIGCIVICATYIATRPSCDAAIVASMLSFLKWLGAGSLFCLFVKIISDSDLAAAKLKAGNKP